MAWPARASFAPFPRYRYRLALWVQDQRCQCRWPHCQPQRWGWWLVLTAPAPVLVALRDWVVGGRRHRACRRCDALLRRARRTSGARVTSLGVADATAMDRLESDAIFTKGAMEQVV